MTARRVLLVVTKLAKGGAMVVPLQIAAALRERGYQAETWFLYRFAPAFENLLEDFDAPLVWSTWPSAFAPPWATASRGYVRFTGKNIHVRGRHVTAQDRLDDVLEVRKRLGQAPWTECFVIVTNPFEGNAVDSLPRIAAALEGPDAGRRYARGPGEPMFPG